jgi:transposase-like protein
MKECKFCGSTLLIKSDIIWNKKRYKCKECNKYFREGEDNRVKYSKKEQEMAFILYTEGNGFRRIASILSKIFRKKIYYQTVYEWLLKRHSSLQLEEKRYEEGTEIIELDELYAIFKKKLKEEGNDSKYGLLFTEEECKCVHLK